MNTRLYLWQGYDDQQHLQQGEIVAKSRQQAKNALLLQGILPASLLRGPILSAKEWRLVNVMLVTRQLATLLQAGLPLVNSLELLATEHPRPAWRYVLKQLQQQVCQGNPLSQALMNYPHIFPADFRELITIGEMTGDLDHCCFLLAEQQERWLKLHKQIKKALRYPLFILIITLLVTLLMLIFVLPEFSALYQSVGAELPIFTQAIITLSECIQRYWIVGIVILSVPVAGVVYYRRNPTSQWQPIVHQLVLRLPWLGHLINHSCLARLFRSLTMTQQAGITLPEGLKSAANAVNNQVYRQKIDAVRAKIEQGQPFNRCLEQDPIFPALVKQLVSAGEASGALDTMLEKLAELYEQQTHEIAERLSQQMEPIMMLVLGVIVGGLVIAMYLPLFQLGHIMT